MNPADHVPPPEPTPPPVKNLEFKAALLLAFLLLLVVGSVLYVAYARGAFESEPGVVFDFCAGRGGKYPGRVPHGLVRHARGRRVQRL